MFRPPPRSTLHATLFPYTTLVRSDPSHARVRDPRSARARVADDALLRAHRSCPDVADLGRARWAGRAPDGAGAPRQPAGDAGRALVLRRPARRGREVLPVRPAPPAHQGAPAGPRVRAARPGHLRQPT